MSAWIWTYFPALMYVMLFLITHQGNYYIFFSIHNCSDQEYSSSLPQHLVTLDQVPRIPNINGLFRLVTFVKKLL